MSDGVCVIGAGIAGLVTAKVLLADGFDVTVFEKAEDLGGVWLASRTYPDVTTNTPREAYAFSDFPYPDSADDFPTGAQVRQYLASYADAFGVRDRIRFSTRVVSVERIGPPGAVSSGPLRVSVAETSSEREPETLEFEYVVVCNGVFSEPYVPDIPGVDEFEGHVIHSSAVREELLDASKRVVVVGAGKSALDCASAASQRSDSCTLVYRSPHWTAPQRILGQRYDHLFFTRFAEAFFRYHRPRGLERTLHGPASPLVKLYWRMQTWLVPRLLGMPDELVPEEPLPGDLDIGVGGAFYEAVEAGRAVPVRDEIASFGRGNRIELQSERVLEADLVIFATGWRQTLPFLDPELRDEVIQNDQFRLYRYILPPGEPRLGFIGYAQSFMSSLTSEIAAHWLSQHFRGELELPGVDAMNYEIDRVLAWADDVFPAGLAGFFVGPHISHYVDDLMEDMGLPTRRTGTAIEETFGRYLPKRYRTVHEQRRRARGEASTS